MNSRASMQVHPNEIQRADRRVRQLSDYFSRAESSPERVDGTYGQDHVQRYADIKDRSDIDRLFKPPYAVDNNRAEVRETSGSSRAQSATTSEDAQEISK
ncbi:hypothetical protein SZ00_06345 (plasmid) [Rhodococcus sp. AD45]|nr:hypothetical protein SZ00_06345 [Rhodococcus sp. AD45]